MRFKSVIGLVVFVQCCFAVDLRFNLALAQEHHTVEYWLEQTAKSPQDAKAWFNLGTLYEQGRGVKADRDKARESYMRSIELDYAPAMFNLGSIYAGLQDYKNAKLWWEKAANKNLPEAQYNLATLYEKGWGVEQDENKAAVWYQRAAETAMQKYLELYNQSKEKFKDNKPQRNKSPANTVLGLLNQLNPIQSAVAAADSQGNRLAINQIERPDVAKTLELAQAVTAQPTAWDWIYSQPKENFTIQLFATKEEAKTDKFIRQYALSEKAIVIPAIVKGTHYYKVVLGSYSKWNDAVVEIGALPQDLREERPWVRKFSALYKEKPDSIAINSSSTGQQPLASAAPAQAVTPNANSSDLAAVENTLENADPALQQPGEGEAITKTNSTAKRKSLDLTSANQTAAEQTIKEETAKVRLNKEETLEAQTNMAQEQVRVEKHEQGKMPARQASTREASVSAVAGDVDSVFNAYAKQQLESDSLPEGIKESLHAGLVALDSKEYAHSYQQLAPLADAGLPEAQFRLALLYAEGKGVGLDLDKAFTYAKLSAEQGHPYGQRVLAEFYSNGVGTQQNVSLADYWKQTSEDNIKKLEKR